MDPSSPYAMQRLIALKDKFDVAFACDTDHDRHGIVTRSTGLLPPNHYLAVCIHYLFQHRPQWRADAGVGKTVVSSSMIDRVTARAGAPALRGAGGIQVVCRRPVDGSLGFGGEESAGATFLRRDGTVWTTDKDGIIAALLAAEITANAGRDPGEIYGDLMREFGEPCRSRGGARDRGAEERLGKLAPHEVRATNSPARRSSVIDQRTGQSRADRRREGELRQAGSPRGHREPKRSTRFMRRVFRGADHLQTIFVEAQAIVGEAIGK